MSSSSIGLKDRLEKSSRSVINGFEFFLVLVRECSLESGIPLGILLGVGSKREIVLSRSKLIGASVALGCL